MKIVVLDGFTENPGDLSWDILEDLGDVTIYPRTSYVESSLISERIGDAEIAITNKTPISHATMNACKNLKCITILATGYNVVDVEYAKSKGIIVQNVPSYGTQIVGQYAVGLLLEICSHYGHHSQTVIDGKWEKCQDWCYWDYPMIELYGKTAGIIGLGRIGRETAGILKALHMKVLANDSFETDEGREVATYVDRDRLFKESDVIFLHCPLLPDTKEIINKDNIKKMKDGVIIINNSRGQLINEQDLSEALNTGKVYAAGLDVVSTEPIRGDNPLKNAKNCIITPHISWAAKEARARILSVTERNVASFIADNAQNVVNR